MLILLTLESRVHKRHVRGRREGMRGFLMIVELQMRLTVGSHMGVQMGVKKMSWVWCLGDMITERWVFRLLLDAFASDMMS